jgi:hypothetical protein
MLLDPSLPAPAMASGHDVERVEDFGPSSLRLLPAFAGVAALETESRNANRNWKRELKRQQKTEMQMQKTEN